MLKLSFKRYYQNVQVNRLLLLYLFKNIIAVVNMVPEQTNRQTDRHTFGH